MRIRELIFVFVTLFLKWSTIRAGSGKFELRMPGIRPKKDDSYICMSMKLPPGDSYIIKYEPDAHKETAHHMLLFGCEEPGRINKPWNCGDMSSGTCRGSESILFGWARDAPALQLPKDVGFKIGGNTKIKYLTLQIHYAHALEAHHFDKSGLTIHVTDVPQPNLASIYLLMAMYANIPPNSQGNYCVKRGCHATGIHVDIACKYYSDQEIHAFAFRTHSHDLGRVITGYRIRDGEWTLLGKGDPHAPQAFYPMENVTTIKKGDYLAARCTYDTINSKETTTTSIGSTASDEMCNFYMMYYRDANSDIDTPELCGEQYRYESLYDSFPNDSDVALTTVPGHHHHSHPSNLDKGTDEKPENETANVVSDKKWFGTNQAAKPRSKCQEKLDAAIAGGLIGAYSPQCNEDGSYKSLQCYASTGYCWCVDSEGNKLEGTEARFERPNCTEASFLTNTKQNSSEIMTAAQPGNDSTKSEEISGAHPTGGDDITKITDVTTDKDIANIDNVTTDVTSRLTDQTTDYNQAREFPTGNSPVKETSSSMQVETSHGVTHDVVTSTSVSEQTTRSSDVVPDSSTRLDFRVSTEANVKYPRTTRSTDESKSSETFSHNNVDETSNGEKHSENNVAFNYPRTTRSTKSSRSTKSFHGNDHFYKTTSSNSDLQPGELASKNNVIFNVSDTWPSNVTEGLGQVTGLGINSAGRLYVFHRSERTWDFDTFNRDNTFVDPHTRGPIQGATILILDGNSGAVLERHGQNMFYLPHGLTIDHQDNLWVTDVGRHQVIKFAAGEYEQPSLVLGENLVPGSDYKHFCKPTDVAVEKSGVFYVSDGYCNARIMKFSPEGKLLNVWGRLSLRDDPLPNTFDIPHSLTLDERRNMLYVADRENGRIQCFDTNGTFHEEISSQQFGGLVFAVDYNDHDDVLYAVNSAGNAKVQGFTINPTTRKIISTWSPHGEGFSHPHAVVSNDSSIFVGEIGPNRVWKLENLIAAPTNDENFVRGLNAAVLESSPTADRTSTDNDKSSGKKAKPSNRPAVVILVILSIPVAVLLVVGLVSKVRQRQHRLPKYDMMDASLGNYSASRSWCNSMNCCDKQYRNMEELYLMDSDSDLEIYPDVHVDRK